MPLSEHEQRMLEQMERALYAEDPKFASTMRGSDARARHRRRALAAVGGFIVGIVLLMSGVIVKIVPMSVGGFIVMLSCAVFAVTSWRRGSAPETQTPAPGAGGPSAAPATSRKQRTPRTTFMDRIEERWRRRRDGQQGGGL